MRRIALLLWLALAPAVQATEVRAWSFRVLLDGREIGQHRFTLLEGGGERLVRSEARFAVRLLFLDAWRYAHRAEERWRGDCLTALTARTEIDGEVAEVRAHVQGAGLRVERPGAQEEHAGCLMSFAYWNPAILAATSLLNAQTGERVPVRTTPLGIETLVSGRRRLEASRHRIEGPGLAIDLWYAGAEWVGLESAVEGGRRLRYELP